MPENIQIPRNCCMYNKSSFISRIALTRKALIKIVESNHAASMAEMKHEAR